MIHIPMIARRNGAILYEGLVWEGKTPADAKLLLIQIALEAGGYAMRDHVAKYGDGPAPPPTAARPSR